MSRCLMVTSIATHGLLSSGFSLTGHPPTSSSGLGDTTDSGEFRDALKTRVDGLPYWPALTSGRGRGFAGTRYEHGPRVGRSPRG